MCTGKEESFREINPFVSGNQENRLISVRNSVWENLTTKTKDPLKRSTGIGLDVPTLLVPACLAHSCSPGRLASQHLLPALQDLPVSPQGENSCTATSYKGP